MTQLTVNSAGPDEAEAEAAVDDPYFRKALAPYTRPRPARTALDIATSVVPYLALWPLMYWALGVSYWLVLAISVLASGFLLRTFILFHDCTHGSLFASRRGNNIWGTFFGLLVFQPFQDWRHHHAAHHGSAGDLDRRGAGDVMTWTIAEYEGKSRRGRLAYRLFRAPLVMFTIGPVYSLLIQPRIVGDAQPHLRRNIIATNFALTAIVAAVCLLIGWREFLLIQAPMIFIAGGAGVWLFYVQHQYEDVYWESREKWSYADAALKGSSYLKLPKVLQFFTGNIGLHHVHHLSARIPNYNLQRAHDENPVFHDVPVLTMGEGLRCSRFKLIDERTGKLLSFAEARAARRGPGAAAGAVATSNG